MSFSQKTLKHVQNTTIVHTLEESGEILELTREANSRITYESNGKKKSTKFESWRRIDDKNVFYCQEDRRNDKMTKFVEQDLQGKDVTNDFDKRWQPDLTDEDLFRVSGNPLHCMKRS
jgi:hypothetical protein